MASLPPLPGSPSENPQHPELHAPPAEIPDFTQVDLGSLDLDSITADASPELIYEQNRALANPSDVCYTFLDDKVIVSVSVPLGAILEELPVPTPYDRELTHGQVFVDEIEEGGNAHTTGLRVGDIIVAFSLPYGDSLMPLPIDDPLDALQRGLQLRSKSDEVQLAVKRGSDVNELRSRVQESNDKSQLTLEELSELSAKVFVDSYPYDSSEDTDEPIAGYWDGKKPALDLDWMRSRGFSMDDDVSFSPSADEENEFELPESDLEEAKTTREIRDEIMRKNAGQDGGAMPPPSPEVLEEARKKREQKLRYWRDLYDGLGRDEEMFKRKGDPDDLD